MGFAQLAGLKEQLSKPAKTSALARPNHGRKDATIANAKLAANAKPVAPVVVTIGRLQKRFPAAFSNYPSPKISLKVGIFDDLISHMTELKLSHAEMRDAFKICCRGNRYTATGQRLITMPSEWIFPVPRPAAFHRRTQAAGTISKKDGWPEWHQTGQREDNFLS
jgi:hypothetical protein